jgi:hypothetical protein
LAILKFCPKILSKTDSFNGRQVDDRGRKMSTGDRNKERAWKKKRKKFLSSLKAFIRKWALRFDRGCQIFIGATYQNIPNDNQMYQTSVKYTIWP